MEGAPNQPYLWRVGSDIIEDIDKNKKESDEKRHSAWK